MWKKPIINMILILLIILVVVYGTIIMVKYFETRDYTVFEKQEEVTNVDISKLEGVYIETTNKISDKYILIKTTNSVKEDENSEESIYVNKLYVFDTDSKSFLENVCTYENVNLEYVGADKENIYLIKKVEGNTTSILEIKYPELEEVKEISLSGIKNIRSDICISNDGSKFAYTTDNGLYVADSNLKNANLVLKVDKTKKTEEAESYIPVKFIDNENLIYKNVGYEWVNEIGSVSLKTKDKSYYEGDNELLEYMDDCIYVRDVYKTLPIQKYNLITKEATIVLQNPEEKYAFNSTISKEKLLVAFNTEKNADTGNERTYTVYSIDNNKNIAEMLTNSDSMFSSTIGLYFIEAGNSVLIVDTDAIKVWKY